MSFSFHQQLIRTIYSKCIARLHTPLHAN